MRRKAPIFGNDAMGKKRILKKEIGKVGVVKIVRED
jgi:hypothetical protein